MNSKNKIISVALAAGMIFSLAACDNQSNNGANSENKEDYMILKTEYNGANVDTVAEQYLDYVKTSESSKEAEILTEYTGTAMAQNFTISWESDGSSQYAVYLADNERFENKKVYLTTRERCNLGGTLIPGTTYYYKVVGENKETKIDSFKVDDNGVRPITVGGAANVRDLGGWKADGGIIAYNLLYRGGKINVGQNCALDENGLDVMKNTLGIKTEIDLRFANIDDGGQTESVLGKDVKYVKAPFHAYNYILPEFSHYGENDRSYLEISASSLKTIFDVLADEKNYPIYFHCNAGADRTGTLAFLIESVLGVSESDMTKDFELTSFSSYGPRYRGKIKNGQFVNGVMQDDSSNFVAFGYFLERIKAVYCGNDESLNAGAVNYLKAVCGVTEEEFSAIRKILIKGMVNDEVK